jgi:YHS domain-containing protein
MATDPVCRMSVDEKQAVATAVYEEKTYYFCSAGCKRSCRRLDPTPSSRQVRRKAQWVFSPCGLRVSAIVPRCNR